ncbi:MAG TPA: hypothetical protein VMN81_07260 [Vicinamibacterales bacterium]|nr:hypothetical protein [Vicinamibacterales bacterium]
MPDAPGAVSDILRSWKEIAAHLRRDVRTVQRWEREEGLPVYRHAAGGRGRVWARRTELDTWWTQSGNDFTHGPDELPPTAESGRGRAVLAVAAVLLAALIWAARPPESALDGVASLVVDVRPFRHPNVIVPGGVVAVAITAPERLLVELDPSTIRAGESAPVETRWQDFDGDGRQELWLYFDVSALGLSPGATRLEIAGRTRDGRLVAGADDVIMVASGSDSVTTVVDRGSSAPDK